MVSCIDLSLSSGQTAYIAVHAVTSSYSVTSFVQNGVIYVGGGCTGSVAPDGYYYNGSNWALVTGGSGMISLIGAPTFTDYRFIQCGTSSENILSASTDTLIIGKTYLIETYDILYGFTQRCVTIIENTSSYAAAVIQSKPSQLTANCNDCNARLSCTVGYSQTGQYVYYYDCCQNFSAYTYNGGTFNFNPSLSHSLNIFTIPTAGFNPCVTPSPTPTPKVTSTNTPTPTPTPSYTPTTTPTPTTTLTPSNEPVTKPKNNCDTFVSFPMGINCSVVSSITTYGGTNGALQVIITGGTSPYTISWANGNRTQTISNLPAGAYPVQVVDYYGDYTANTICYLTDPKLNCNLAGSVSQIIGLPSPTPTMTQTLTPTITTTPTTTPTPTNILEKMKLSANGVTSVNFTLSSTQGYRITWSGTTATYYSAGSTTPTYTYSSPYTGDIFVESLNLTTISSFTVDASPIVSVILTTSEFKSLDGLIATSIYDGVRLIGIASELPANLTYFSTAKNYLSGSTYDLPRSLTSTTITATNRITGSTYGLPRGLIYFEIQQNNGISGDTAGLPTGLTKTFIGTNNTISGNTSGLPRTLTQFNIAANNILYGDTADLPTGMTYCFLGGSNTVSGNTLGLPRTLTTFLAYGNNTISGNMYNLPSGLEIFEVYGSNRIGGDILDLPRTIIELGLQGSGTTLLEIPYGDVSNLPPNIESLYIYSNNIISGNAANIPLTAKNVVIGDNNTINTYTYPHVWAPIMSQVSLFGSVSNNSLFIDNMLIDLTASTWSGLKLITLKGISSATATAAVADLKSRGVTITITP